MALNRFEINPAWIWEGDYGFGGGRLCGECLVEIDERPTAIVAANDAMAIGLIQRLHDEGWELPRDFSIVGFDNIDSARWSVPALTTVDQRLGELAGKAAELLLARIRALEANPADTPVPRSVSVSPMLIPRASVAAM